MRSPLLTPLLPQTLRYWREPAHRAAPSQPLAPLAYSLPHMYMFIGVDASLKAYDLEALRAFD